MQLINDYTVLILTGFLQLVLVVIGWFGRVGCRHRAAIRVWVLAQTLFGVGQLLRLGRDSDWLFLTSTVPNSTVSLGLGLMAIALCQLYGQPYRKLVPVVLVATVLQLVLRHFGMMEANRLAMVSLIFALQFMVLILVIVRISRIGQSPLLTAMQFANVFAVIASLVRVQEAAGSGPLYHFLSAGPGQRLALLAMYAVTLINGMVFLLLAERMSQQSAAK